MIEGNDIRHGPSNETLTRGGGIATVDADVWIVANVIRGNHGGRGAGIAAAGPRTVIRGNSIEDNVADHDHGGGVFVSGPDIEISGNRIVGNEIGRDLGYGWGGGVFVHDLGTYARLFGNFVSENFAPDLGAGVFIDNEAAAVIWHELYVANACPVRGGAALYVDGLDDSGQTGSMVTVRNVTFADHACSNELGGNAVFVEGGSQVIISNSIFWNNGGEVYAATGSLASVVWTLSDEAIPGIGNQQVADPQLGDGYHPRSRAGRWDATRSSWIADPIDSPALDAADPSTPASDEPWPNGGRANLGFDGASPQASRSKGLRPIDRY